MRCGLVGMRRRRRCGRSEAGMEEECCWLVGQVKWWVELGVRENISRRARLGGEIPCEEQ